MGKHNDKDIMLIAVTAMQEAYNDLQEVFSQRQMMGEQIPEAVSILRKALIEIKEANIPKLHKVE